jgi:hypothetical protein
MPLSKSDLTIFSLTIPSMSNASQWKDNATIPLQSFQLSMARAAQPLYCCSPQ